MGPCGLQMKPRSLNLDRGLFSSLFDIYVND